MACNSESASSEPEKAPSPKPTASSSPIQTATPTPRPFNAGLDIGVVVPGTDCSELHIRNTDLKPGDKIRVVIVEDSPQRLRSATVVGPNNCPNPPGSGISMIEVDDGETFAGQYEIRFDDNAQPTFGIGVVIEDPALKIVNGTAQLKVADSSAPLYFRDCSGNESYHMTVWEGKPLTGKRLWHGYISLSYATVPTCKPAEYR